MIKERLLSGIQIPSFISACGQSTGLPELILSYEERRKLIGQRLSVSDCKHFDFSREHSPKTSSWCVRS